MKNQMNHLRKVFAAITFILITSCELQELNIDPNRVNDAPVAVILPAAQTNLIWGMNDFAAHSTSSLVQYLTGTLNVQNNVTNYAYLPANFDVTWSNHFYAGAMKDFNTIISKATENGAFHYRGIAKIMMAMAIGQLVDLWGDVPYTEAFDIVTFPRPKYDAGATLYQQIFALLDEGIADLDAVSSFSPTRNDLMFTPPANTELSWRTNSLPRWKKAANALKARYHNHLSKVNPTGSADDALAAIAAGTFTSNTEEMKVSFGAGTNDTAGPWFSFLLGTFGLNNINVCATFVNLLKNRVAPDVNDPRLAFYVSQNANGQYVGTALGATSIGATSSRLGPFVNSNAAPTNIITYAEVKFIEAEARFRKGQFTEAATALNEAIKANILRVTGSANEAYETLYASENETTIQINGLEKIFTEKYIAMFLQTEAWVDWRRSIPANAAGTVSGMPSLSPPPNNETLGVFPRRFLYPQNELVANSVNVPDKTLTDKVFWDL
jgi:hypothetical protein